MLRPGGLEWMEWNGGIRETMDDCGMRVEEWVLKDCIFPIHFTILHGMVWHDGHGRRIHHYVHTFTLLRYTWIRRSVDARIDLGYCRLLHGKYNLLMPFEPWCYTTCLSPFQ